MTEVVNAPAPAPAPGPTPSPAPAPAPAPAPSPAPAPAPASWFAQHPDQAVIDWASLKGLPDAHAALSTAYNAEKLIGFDRAGKTVVMPDEADAPAMQKFYERLGRPANPGDYKLPVPQGQDPAFANAMSAKMHELGLTTKQAQGLAASVNEFTAQALGAQSEAEQAKWQAEDAQLAKDWGAERPARTELAKRAAKEMGLSEDNITALEKVAGFSGVMKALAKVGDMLTHDGTKGMSTPGSFEMTPEGARAKKAQLMADPEWRGKAMKANSSQWSELQKLDQIIAAAMAASTPH